MALIKTRPNVRLLLTRPLVVGEVGAFIVELDCPKPIPVDAVSLTFYGEVVWFTTSQYGRHRHSSRFVEQTIPLLAEPGTQLEAGTHRLHTRLALDSELPGSWEGDRLAVVYGVRVHVDIPWWPDARVDFVVQVTARQRELEGRARAVFVTRAEGPPAKGPYLELALSQQVISPGEMLEIGAALGNVGQNRYRKLHVALVASESFPAGLAGSFTHPHPVARWSLPVDDPAELQPIPFSIRIPTSVAPGFSIHNCQLRWALDVHADVAWGVDPKLRVPLAVLPRPVTTGEEIAAPLAVGSERVRLIWSRVAKLTESELRDDRLHRFVGEAMIEVHRRHVDNRPRVVGVIEFPRLGVALGSRRSRSLLGGATPAFTARDPRQAELVDRELGEIIREPDAPDLLAVSDTRIELALDGAGVDFDSLADFIRFLARLARAIEELRPRLPEPEIMGAHLPRWQAAAEAQRGRLSKADCRLVLARGEQELTIACEFDDEGQLRGTSIELDPGVAIPSRHALLWTGDTALPEHSLALAELARPPSWAPSPRPPVLQIESNRVRVFLPAPLPDPLAERERIEQLFALGRQLRGEQGPYR